MIQVRFFLARPTQRVKFDVESCVICISNQYLETERDVEKNLILPSSKIFSVNV